MKKILLASLLLITNQTVFAQTDSTTNQTVLPLNFNTGNPAPYGMAATTIQIQGKTLPILFDTGAGKTELALTEHALQGLQVTFTGTQHCGMVREGKLCKKQFIIPEVTIGAFTVKNVKGELIQHLWDSGHTQGFIETEASRNGILGLALLSKFNVLLDYPHAQAVLVQPKHNPTQYDTTQWSSVPFQGNLRTELKVNDKPIVLVWDTGANPSSINRSEVANFKQTSCTQNKPYNPAKNCLLLNTTSFTGLDGSKLPNSWFMIDDLPTYAPFDGLVGSNFYQNNLVYFDFDDHKIYVKASG